MSDCDKLKARAKRYEVPQYDTRKVPARARTAQRSALITSALAQAPAFTRPVATVRVVRPPPPPPPRLRNTGVTPAPDVPAGDAKAGHMPGGLANAQQPNAKQKRAPPRAPGPLLVPCVDDTARAVCRVLCVVGVLTPLASLRVHDAFRRVLHDWLTRVYADAPMALAPTTAAASAGHHHPAASNKPASLQASDADWALCRRVLDGGSESTHATGPARRRFLAASATLHRTWLHANRCNVHFMQSLTVVLAHVFRDIGGMTNAPAPPTSTSAFLGVSAQARTEGREPLLFVAAHNDVLALHALLTLDARDARDLPAPSPHPHFPLPLHLALVHHVYARRQRALLLSMASPAPPPFGDANAHTLTTLSQAADLPQAVASPPTPSRTLLHVLLSTGMQRAQGAMVTRHVASAAAVLLVRRASNVTLNHRNERGRTVLQALLQSPLLITSPDAGVAIVRDIIARAVPDGGPWWHERFQCGIHAHHMGDLDADTSTLAAAKRVLLVAGATATASAAARDTAQGAAASSSVPPPATHLTKRMARACATMRGAVWALSQPPPPRTIVVAATTAATAAGAGAGAGEGSSDAVAVDHEGVCLDLCDEWGDTFRCTLWFGLFTSQWRAGKQPAQQLQLQPQQQNGNDDEPLILAPAAAQHVYNSYHARLHTYGDAHALTDVPPEAVRARVRRPPPIPLHTSLQTFLQLRVLLNEYDARVSAYRAAVVAALHTALHATVPVADLQSVVRLYLFAE